MFANGEELTPKKTNTWKWSNATAEKFANAGLILTRAYMHRCGDGCVFELRMILSGKLEAGAKLHVEISVENIRVSNFSTQPTSPASPILINLSPSSGDICYAANVYPQYSCRAEISKITFESIFLFSYRRFPNIPTRPGKISNCKWNWKIYRNWVE